MPIKLNSSERLVVESSDPSAGVVAQIGDGGISVRLLGLVTNAFGYTAPMPVSGKTLNLYIGGVALRDGVNVRTAATGSKTGSGLDAVIVEWGDGQFDSYSTPVNPSTVSHTYAELGDYTVKIRAQLHPASYAPQAVSSQPYVTGAVRLS